MLSLRHGTAPAWSGADDDVSSIVERLRAVWPEVEISIRGDAGSWSAPRCTIVKVEVNSEGTNRRVILTNRPGGAIIPGGDRL